MAKGYISKRSVDAATPAERDTFLWDDDGKGVVKGFGLKVSPTGNKVYIYQYRIAIPGAADRTPPKRYTIGRHGDITAEQARDQARALAAMVARGIDPRQRDLDEVAAHQEASKQAEEKARLEGELLFEKVAERWLDAYENSKRRPSSVKQAKLVVERHLKKKLAGRPMPHIAKTELQAVIDAIPAKQRGMRRAVYAYARVLWRWAVVHDYAPSNLLEVMERPEAPEARDRVLSDDELLAVWNASRGLSHPFGHFFRLLMLTGQRRSEVAGIMWGELDRATATWTIPIGRAKNRVAHIVPLSPEVIAELDDLSLAEQVKAEAEKPDAANWPKAGYVLTTRLRTPISGITKAKAALDDAIAKARDNKPLEHWRIHDLRRTMATGFQRMGTRFEVTEAVLNHVSGSRSGVAGIYQRHDWSVEKRNALDAWARHVAGLRSPVEQGNVIAIKAAKKSA